jgi:hypothetical protein
MFAADGADANTPEREDPGFHRDFADHLDDFSHIDVLVEIGGIFDGKVRHVLFTPFPRSLQAK